MAKRPTGVGKGHGKPPHKTKKRLEAKKVMLSSKKVKRSKKK